MTIKRFCIEHNITEDQFYGREVINHSLNWSNVTSIPNGVGGIYAQFNPTVNGFINLSSLIEIPNRGDGGIYVQFNPIAKTYLDLERVTKLPDNFSPIVGTWLDIRNVKRLPIGFNPQVSRSIFLNNDIICGDLICEESVKESLKLMIQSVDEDIVGLAFSLLWKYRTEDIKEIANDKILFKP